MRGIAHRTIPILVVLALAGPRPAAAQQPAPAPPCAAPEYHQFDFWLGDWVVTTPDGKPSGTNLVTRPLGDCVVQEHWQGAGGMKGESYNIYDRAGGRWHQTWVSDRGALLMIEGGLVGKNMVMTGPPRSQGGRTLVDRITWTPASASEVHQVWEQSADGGKTWTVTFHGVYRPRAAAN